MFGAVQSTLTVHRTFTEMDEEQVEAAAGGGGWDAAAGVAMSRLAPPTNPVAA